jgi:hypothetical protein
MGKHGVEVKVGWEEGAVGKDGTPGVFKGEREMDKLYLL